MLDKTPNPSRIFLTFSPKFIRHVTPRKQFDSTIADVRRVLGKVSRYEIYPELNQNGNIHYHMLLSLKDDIKYYRWALPYFKRHGMTKSMYVKNEKGIVEYLSKDIKRVTEVLSDESLNNLVIPINNENDMDIVLERGLTPEYHDYKIDEMPMVKKQRKELIVCEEPPTADEEEMFRLKYELNQLQNIEKQLEMEKENYKNLYEEILKAWINNYKVVTV